jgi:hypothetical protein
MIKYLRRVGVATALIGTVLAGTLFIPAGAAQADVARSGQISLLVTPGPRSACSGPTGNSFGVWFQDGVLVAKHWCYGQNPPPVPKGVTIERLTAFGMVPHVEYRWVIVAQGGGDVRYTCQGNTPSRFRFNQGRFEGEYACG